MATTQMPEHLTKVSYILEKLDKPKLLRAAERKGLSMSALITETLTRAGILRSEAARSRSIQRGRDKDDAELDRIAIKDPEISKGRKPTAATRPKSKQGRR